MADEPYSFDYPVEVGGDFSYTTQIDTTPPPYPFVYDNEIDESFEYKTNIAEDYGFLEYNSTDETDTIIKKTNTNLQQTLSQQKTHVRQIKNRFDEIKDAFGQIKNVFNVRIGATKSELDEIRDNTNLRFSQTKRCLNKIRAVHIDKVNDLRTKINNHKERLDNIENLNGSSTIVTRVNNHTSRLYDIEHVTPDSSELARRVLAHLARIQTLESSVQGIDGSISTLTQNLATAMADISTLKNRTAMHTGNAFLTLDNENPQNSGRYVGSWSQVGTITVGNETLKIWKKTSS